MMKNYDVKPYTLLRELVLGSRKTSLLVNNQ
jgi:hypothetical protein